MSQLLQLIDRPIAFQRSFVRLGVGVTGALLLSQMVYWHNRTDGEWFYKTQAELEDETGLSRYEQEGARKKLLSCGVLEELKKGIPAKLYFRVNESRLQELLFALDEIGQSSNQGWGISASLEAEIQQAGMGKTSTPACGIPASIHTVDYTETTTETTKTLGASGDEPPAKKNKNAYPEEFEKAWKAYPAREGSNPKNSAYSAWNARNREGVDPEAMLAGVIRYANFCQAKGQTGTTYVMQGQRFFGKAREFENTWIVASQSLRAGRTDTHSGFDNRDYGDSQINF